MTTKRNNPLGQVRRFRQEDSNNRASRNNGKSYRPINRPIPSITRPSTSIRNLMSRKSNGSRGHIGRSRDKRIGQGSSLDQSTNILRKSSVNCNCEDHEGHEPITNSHKDSYRNNFGLQPTYDSSSASNRPNFYRNTTNGGEVQDLEDSFHQSHQNTNWKTKRKQWSNNIFSILSICLMFAMLLSCVVVFILQNVDSFADEKMEGNISSSFSEKHSSKIQLSSNLRNFKERNNTSVHGAKDNENHSSLLFQLRSLSDLSDAFDHMEETPFFWEVALTGESVAKKVFSHCHNLVQACELGVRQPRYNEDMLETFTIAQPSKVNSNSPTSLLFNATYVNVDMSTLSGLQRAAELNLASSHEADVVSSPSLHQTNNLLFTIENKARLFAFFRHPIDRAVGWYNHISYATWDHANYNPDVKSMSLVEYASSTHIVDNPITRMLAIGPDEDNSRVLTDDDLKLAKEIVRSKCLVGLYRDRLGSLARFGRYFASVWDQRWENVSDGREERQRKIHSCRKKIVQRGDKTMNHGLVVQIGSKEWDALAKMNKLDLELYEHIEKMYEIQGVKIFDVV